MLREVDGYTNIDEFEIDGTSTTNVRTEIYIIRSNCVVTNSSVHHVAKNFGCDDDHNGSTTIIAYQHFGAAFDNYYYLGDVVRDI